MEKVRIAINEWFDWLDKYGVNPQDIDDRFNWFKKYPVSDTGTGKEIEIEIAEMLKTNYNPAEAGKPEPLFWSEVLPVQINDIERTLLLMECSRRDLLNLVFEITDGCLDWTPPGRPRTIRNCLRHIAYVEPWYITRLDIELPENYPENVFELLNHTRDKVIDSLHDFPERKMKGVFQPKKDINPVCDLWTARKVLRRLVDHERLHTRYIQRVLKMYHKTRD